MNVHIALIASRTRMKPSGTKIPSISDVILGLAQLCRVMQQPSTPRQHDPTRRIPAVTAVKTFLAPAFPRQLQVVIN